MNRWLRFVFVAVLGIALVAGLPARANSQTPTRSAASPGAELATAVSQITGIAISPLLGMGAIGAYKWFQAGTPQAKARLPWFAQPWFWIPALLLVAAVAAKDTLGTVVPTSLKKPLDVAEAVENKISGLVATGAIVPLALAIFQSFDDSKSAASLSQAGFAAIDFSPVLNVLMVPLALLIYAVVWVVSNTINILILVSPFSTVDAALKSFRAAILASVAGTHFLSDSLGLVWAGVVILVSLFLAGWAFRLFIFGNVFLWDILTFRRHRFTPQGSSNWCFLARRIGRVPVRTYGRLEMNSDGQLTFRYRPFLVLPEKTISLPAGNYAIGRGLWHSELLNGADEAAEDVIDLPPRYKGHEATLAANYGLAGVRDVGLRAAWTWLKGLFGGEVAAGA
jgi:hypothetical protein